MEFVRNVKVLNNTMVCICVCLLKTNSKIDYENKSGKYLLKLTGQKLISTSVGSTVPFSLRRRSVHVTHESQVQRYREGGAVQADSNSPMLSTTLCHNLKFSLLDNAPN